MKPDAFIDRVVVGSLDGSNIPIETTALLKKRRTGRPLLVCCVILIICSIFSLFLLLLLLLLRSCLGCDDARSLAQFISRDLATLHKNAHSYPHIQGNIAISCGCDIHRQFLEAVPRLRGSHPTAHLYRVGGTHANKCAALDLADSPGEIWRKIF